MRAAYQDIGLGAGQVGGPVSFSGVQEEISGNRSVETGIYWTSGGGPDQVIYGYDTNSQTIS